MNRNATGNPEKALIAKAAGRCEFETCNKFLYLDDVEYKACNHAQKAHIKAFSPNGPRGSTAESGNNDVDNIMLLCPKHHKYVDDNPDIFTDDVLRRMKKEHEDYVERVMNSKPLHRCVAFSYFSSIYKNTSLGLSVDDMRNTLMHYGYYTDGPVIHELGTNQTIIDGNTKNTETLANMMESVFSDNNDIRQILNNPKYKVALFALAPIPLLIKLGTLIPKGCNVDVYQKMNAGISYGWGWNVKYADVVHEYELQVPKSHDSAHVPVLALSLTAKVHNEEIQAIFRNTGTSIDIWNLGISKPGYDLIGNKESLAGWKSKVMETINTMEDVYGKKAIHIFPIMNNAYSVVFGMSRVMKSNSAWIIYDRVGEKFKRSLLIGGDENVE